jgi:hypothetical protein
MARRSISSRRWNSFILTQKTVINLFLFCYLLCVLLPICIE